MHTVDEPALGTPQHRTSRDDADDFDIVSAIERLRSGELTAIELVERCLQRVELVNGGAPSMAGSATAVNAWARIYPDRARATAHLADARLAAEGARAPLLCGVPVGLKDLFGVAGLPVTASSEVIADCPTEHDSEAWAQLSALGAVVLGHTHTHEFAAGATTDQVGNPWDLSRSAGGSSGGSAAAIAAGMVPAALGTDTAGSLRIPAALCGITSLKPTRGVVSLDGVIPLAPTLDHAGPMARTAADCAVLFAALIGENRALPRPTPRRRPLSGVRIAYSVRIADVDAEVAEAVARATAAFEQAGAQVVEIPGPDALGTVDADPSAPSEFLLLLLTELWSHHSRNVGRLAQYQADVRATIEKARRAALGPEDYATMQVHREETTRRWQAWMVDNDIDGLIEPTTPCAAPPRGTQGHPDPSAVRLATLTSLWNLTGHPVVALPAGLGRVSSMPVGISLVGRHYTDRKLLQLAIDVQESSLLALPLPTLPVKPPDS